MKMEKWGSKKFSIILISCMLAMLLLFYTFVNFTFSWLFTSVQKDSMGTTNLATTDGTISSTSGTYEVTLPQTGGTADLSGYGKITNTGTAPALVRVFYSIYVNEAQKEIATTSALSKVSINTAFVASDENIDNVYSGYYYYNTTLSVGETISFLNTAVPTGAMAYKKIKINMIVELVNYQGGAYQLGQALPWKNTPASWSFNNNIITKPAGSIVTPKLDITFKDISKLEITAKTTTTTQNILLCRYNGAYIGMNGSAWSFNQLTNGAASLSPAQFTNGNYNTITFTWSGSTDTSTQPLTFVWDATWSKEVSYKQIKIWNTDGELIYDLRPNMSQPTTGGAITADGKFVNKIGGEVLNMYNISGASLTSTTTTYSAFCDVLYSQDFEAFSTSSTSILSVDQGASAAVSTTEHHFGSKSAVITNSYNLEDIPTSNTTYARALWVVNGKAGYKYNISFWVKSTAPSGSLAYRYNPSGDLVAQPSNVQVAVSGVNGSNFTMYDCSSEWTLISVCSDTLATDTTIYFQFAIPTGKTYSTYVDDIVIKAYK